MKKYILKRILTLLPTIFIVSVVIFLLVHLTPGDPAAMMLGEDATLEDIAALHTKLGLDDPLVVQYFRWVGRCLQGDFGTSTAVAGQKVSMMVFSHFRPTLSLAIYSQIITILIAIPTGILAAKNRGKIADFIASVLSLLGISLPSFMMGLGLVLLVAVHLRWLPAAGYKDLFTDGLGPFLRYMTLPALSLGFIHSAYMMRMTKASMLEVLGSDYIKMARSKGVKEHTIIGKHAFRNALLTVITVVGQGFISALAGAAVVEKLFTIPGIGTLMVDSIEKRDYQVIQAITLMIAMLNVVINLGIDLIYGLCDPRIRLD
ncbi:MAG: ABC transporter permease [Clostridiales bacterium]|nr:ABC transporter permease [Clostridiales bacterium]